MGAGLDTVRMPRGGWHVGRQLHAWNWKSGRVCVSQANRCNEEQTILIDAQRLDSGPAAYAVVMVRFWSKSKPIGQRAVRLQPLAADGQRVLGWVETPLRASHFAVELPAGSPALFELNARCVEERCGKCHPLANTPRWSAYRPAFPIERIVLPRSLASLAELFPEFDVTVIDQPKSRNALARAVIGAGCIVPPEWVRGLRLTLKDLELLASAAYLTVDLETVFNVLPRRVETELVTHRAAHDVTAGRNEYSDVATRGLALQDVFPYGSYESGRFMMRFLRNTRSWRDYAERQGFATMISSETPEIRTSGHVVLAARPFEHGEMIASDLPWIMLGRFGLPVAPQLARHLLRMLFHAPLPDGVQFWCDWEDTRIVIRDVADLARRCPPLRALRWAKGSAAQLGLHLPAADDARAHLLIRTGRVDHLIDDAGMPAEPMMIVMKSLAREVRESSEWHRAFLSRVHVTWSFASADGLKYTVLFNASPDRARVTHELDLTAVGQAARAAAGLLGDGSIGQVAELLARIRRQIELAAGPSLRAGDQDSAARPRTAAAQ